jgi:DNA-binding transcriptional LysR family regulator
MLKEVVETFNIGASYIIGSYILPGEPIYKISKTLNQKIKLNITECDKIVAGVERGEFNLGLIENPIFKRGLIYKEWLRDELVLCSKVKLPDELDIFWLNRLNLITRDDKSPTKDTISKFLKKAGLSYRDFNSTIRADNPTALIQGVKWSRPDSKNPTVSIVSKIAIDDEVRAGKLHISRIEGLSMVRTFYIVYRRDNIELMKKLYF